MESDLKVEDVFSLRRPKDIKAGLASGLKSVAKGVVGGTVGLLAAPTVGAMQDGLPGFARGIATGVAGAVLLPVTGATVAAIQVARGIINQPEAIAESFRGKAWDQEHRCWVEQPDCAITPYDAAAALHWHCLGLTGALGCRHQQLDYYELLEVSRDATSEEIKRQYYKLARKHHPDKNVGDEEAHERFQQLGEAYQVLSNPQLRQQYDAHGVEGVQGDLMDSAAFFACLFGSEMFDHLVGELAIATMARLGESMSSTELQEAQAHRVQQLTVYLTALLRRYVEGDTEGFKLAVQQEAEHLASASYGATLLHCIGAVYSSQADIYLGGLLGGTLACVRQGTHTLRSHLNIANAALKVLAHQDKLAAFDSDCEQRRQQQQHDEARQTLHSNRQDQQQQPAGVQPSADLLYDTGWFGDSYVSSATAVTAMSAQQQDQPDLSSSGISVPELDCTDSSPHNMDHMTANLRYEALLESLPLNGRSNGLTASTAAMPNPATNNSSMHTAPCQQHNHMQLPTVTGPMTEAAEATVPGGGAADSAQVAVNELLQRSQLEELSMQLCMEAMWAANVVDIQQTLGKVCQVVLYDGDSSHTVRQLRAQALRKLGTIFCSVPEPADASQVNAKQQVQAAYEAMLAKQLAREDAMDEVE